MPGSSEVILSASIMGLGMHLGSWMAREGEASDYLSADTYASVAQTAERGKLHALFFADALTNAEEGTDRPSLGALDPSIVLATMAHATSRIGLVGTASHLLVPDAEFSGSIGFRKSLADLAVKENLTVRQLIGRYGGGHHQEIGTPEQIADHIQNWFEQGAADGFNLMVDIVPSCFESVVDMLVPELQRRGLFHEDYEHEIFRQNLGLGAPARLATAA